MRRLAFIAIAIAGLVAGCSGDATRMWEGLQSVQVIQRAVQGKEVPGPIVTAAARAFGAMELAAASYLSLKRCTADSGPVCRDPRMTPVIKGAVQSGRIARNAMLRELRAVCAAEYAARQPCNKGIPVASYNTLVSATKAIEDATAAYRAATGT